MRCLYPTNVFLERCLSEMFIVIADQCLLAWRKQARFKSVLLWEGAHFYCNPLALGYYTVTALLGYNTIKMLSMFKSQLVCAMETNVCAIIYEWAVEILLLLKANVSAVIYELPLLFVFNYLWMAFTFCVQLFMNGLQLSQALQFVNVFRIFNWFNNLNFRVIKKKIVRHALCFGGKCLWSNFLKS